MYENFHRKNYRLLKYDSYVRPCSTSAVSNLSFFCSFLCNVYLEASGARWKTNGKAQKPKFGHSWGSNALPLLSWTGVAHLMYMPLYYTYLCCVHTFSFMWDCALSTSTVWASKERCIVSKSFSLTSTVSWLDLGRCVQRLPGSAHWNHTLAQVVALWPTSVTSWVGERALPRLCFNVSVSVAASVAGREQM